MQPGESFGDWENLILCQPFQAQEVSMWRNRHSGSLRVCCTFDGNKLYSRDTIMVSGWFSLVDMDFRLHLRPDNRNFETSQGCGNIHVKCADSSCQELEFMLHTSSGRSFSCFPGRGTFYGSGLPLDLAVWDFKQVVDPSTKTFVVCLELLP